MHVKSPSILDSQNRPSTPHYLTIAFCCFFIFIPLRSQLQRHTAAAASTVPSASSATSASSALSVSDWPSVRFRAISRSRVVVSGWTVYEDDRLMQVDDVPLPTDGDDEWIV